MEYLLLHQRLILVLLFYLLDLLLDFVLVHKYRWNTAHWYPCELLPSYFKIFIKKKSILTVILQMLKLGNTICLTNRIDSVMVSVLDSSAVDRGFEPLSGQTKDFKIGICFLPTKHAALRTGWLGIRIMCSSGATCLSADCCFSEQAL